MHEHNWPVSFSMGVATFRDITVNIEDIVNIADKLMYVAKKSGKDRILHKVVAQKEAPAYNDHSCNMKAHIISKH